MCCQKDSSVEFMDTNVASEEKCFLRVCVETVGGRVLTVAIADAFTNRKQIAKQ